jgi:hypothetical protein
MYELPLIWVAENEMPIVAGPSFPRARKYSLRERDLLLNQTPIPIIARKYRVRIATYCAVSLNDYRPVKT